ncbi:N-acetylneuraminate synthase family protein [Mycolicibacterium rhodesiae]|uniref:Spore coat protein n=1 Tax=Mycolicibacterium rhodesiae TaxID=36814 RepID=A0A1X0IM07_MYCRH|nr:N-acetylneuraminate synthase family protein [Mycolicibacterium rhodesiae]MCV7347652.1 N-acetylneuraminate synthase family protein [Mycolicibacterium rhodesiae]ORB49239.1 spore coat protein [Mycolicibacterium rhodesiae]
MKTGVASSQIPDWLFIFEMANNHMGDVDHGVRLVSEFGSVAKDFDFRFAFKMQYRALDTFIHPDYQGRDDIKYIKRFEETRLSPRQTRKLVDAIRDNGFVPVCTPFDEESVDRVVADGFDILKIASCSLTDWPLLEKAVSSALPMIVSTAGSTIEEIDNVVAFLKHRNRDFVLMHCVAEYPTSDDKLQLNQIDFLRQRYDDVRIGYSTHERPTETLPVAVAIGKGCTVFEKHVGLTTDRYGINGYSAGPAQTRAWLEMAQTARTISGISGERSKATPDELGSLLSLRRGVFADRDIKAGERIGSGDVFMAIPTQEGHVTANDWSKYSHYYAIADIRKNDPILVSNSRREEVREKVFDIVQRVKSLLTQANVVVPGQAELEVSHHYGIDNFDEFGITMITVVNREYCKKLIVVLPGQHHPEQYHNQKEETFHVLYGDLDITLDGEARECGPGDVITVERTVRHAFTSKTGAIFEEISSTHHKDDSFYTDPKVGENKQRKTLLTHWM